MQILPFSNVLEALGAVDTFPIETSKNWDFFKVKYPTPGGEITANYLCLAHDCPLGEATAHNLSKWNSLAGAASGYTVVSTTRSRLAQDLPRTSTLFKGRAATTPRKLLFDNVVQALVPSAEKLEGLKELAPEICTGR
jgi:hypothetical protein